ncbi:MAG: hypothetical protein AAGF81_00070 [Pseudomonadota bacterium]
MGYRKSRTVGWTDYAALGAGAVVIALSFLSLPVSVPSHLFSFVGVDKVGHFACYAVVGVLAMYHRRRLSSALLTAGAILYLSGIIEIVQGQFNRTTDLADFVANGLGLALAGILVTLMRSMRRARRRTFASASANSA